MKRVPFFFIAIFFLQAASAQVGGTVVAGGNVVVMNASSPPVHLQDVFSTAVQPKSSPGVNGSPFVYDNWLLARLTFADGRFADSMYIKLNAYENKVHFKNENGEELQATIKINEIKIIDENTVWHNVVFRSGYEGDMNPFFQVLSDGKKMQLLKKMMVVKWETRALGEEDRKTFQLDQELFLSVNGKLFSENKKCTYLSEVLGADNENALKFISDNNIKCNKEDDMKRLVEYVNSL